MRDGTYEPCRCRRCGETIADDVTDGLCNGCRNMDALIAALDDDTPDTPDTHPSDEELKARLLAIDPDGQSTVISRQADGTYLDLRSGQAVSDWRDFQ